MSPSATPATQSDAHLPRRMHVDETQSEGRCRQVPRLPREVKVDVAKLCVVKSCVSIVSCVRVRCVCGQVVCEQAVCE